MDRLRQAFGGGDRVNVLGVHVDPVTMANAVARIIGWAAGDPGPARLVFATGVHGVMEARRHPSFQAVLDRADLNVPDGMPLVWLGRSAGFHRMERVSGPDLMLAVCDAGRERGIRHFFCGGRQGVAATLAESLTSRYPGLAVSGTYVPPMSPLTHEDFLAIAGAWKRSRAQILWLGVSTPKQEQWALALTPMMQGGVIATVGAAFDYHAGRIRRAPRWMQRAGLEWLFRLCREPRRLGGRYFSTIPPFMALVALQALGRLDRRREARP
jgi:N-acetylglucosaminyldiphosphoundecaprenol N-acetyl-beta-D-mannosaminyltransferase